MDPYYLDLCRCSIDQSTDFRILTKQTVGHHEWMWSTTKNYAIVTCSTVNNAPVVNLICAKKGTLLCPLEMADVSELLNSKNEKKKIGDFQLCFCS